MPQTMPSHSCSFVTNKELDKYGAQSNSKGMQYTLERILSNAEEIQMVKVNVNLEQATKA